MVFVFTYGLLVSKLRSAQQRTPYVLVCPLIKPLVLLIYHVGVALIIYFREHSRIADYCYSRPVVLSLWKSFFAKFVRRYKNFCFMEKCKRYESNIPQQAYKACPITAWVLLQNESERIRTFNILPPARSLSNTRFLALVYHSDTLS